MTTMSLYEVPFSMSAEPELGSKLGLCTGSTLDNKGFSYVIKKIFT